MSKIDQTAPPNTNAVAAIPPIAYLLTASVAAVGCNSLALGPIAPEVARGFAVTAPAVMTAASAFGLGTAASALFLARHIDRFGARRMLGAALVALAAALALCALAPVLAVLVAGQLLAGAAAGIVLPAAYASAAAVAPKGRESETIGVVLIGWTLSMVAGVPLSALLADLVHWRAVFAAVAVLALLPAAALTLQGGRDTISRRLAERPLAALAAPGLKPLLCACFFFMAGFYGIYGYLGDHVHTVLGRSVSANGVLAVSYGLGFGAAAFLDGVIDRVGARRAMPAAFVAVAAVFVLMALGAGSYWWLVGLVSVWGLVNHFGLNSLVMRLAAVDPARRGAIMGLNSAVTYLAVFAGTTAFGPVYAGMGIATSALVAALLMAAALFAATRR